jgi:uncharacterized protein
MTDFLSRPCTAFAGNRMIAEGPLIGVALAVKAAIEEGERGPVLTFDDETGQVIDLDLRGSKAELIARLAGRSDGPPKPAAEPERPAEPVGRGRPKLGVVAREVTLLPRHWEWLAAQSGGASAALRRLVDEARKSDGGRTQARQVRETTYRFMSAVAGDLPGFEEATRALFAENMERFRLETAAWPSDIRDHVLKLAGQDDAAPG